jgi:hypothetical protein
MNIVSIGSIAPEIVRAIALVLCVWAVMAIGNGRHE